jgi:hypothetical protein
VGGLELADEARVPELRGDAQVLAAAHQRVGLAPLARRGDRLLGEVRALAARLGDEPVGTESTMLATGLLPQGDGEAEEGGRDEEQIW